MNIVSTVDCRECAYFKYYHELDDRYKKMCWRVLKNMGRPGIPLGWCYKYSRPVTYYKGRCRGFLHRRKALKTIIEYLEGG